MMTARTVVSLKHVSKYYKLYETPRERFKEAFSLSGKAYHKRFYALSDVDLDVRMGETLAVLGKNGSGKSTLLSIIAGILHPSSGRTLSKGRICAMLSLGAGFNPEFTGRENIRFYRTVLGYQEDVSGSELEEIVSFAELDRFIDQPLRTYSKGMVLRLAFSAAISNRPDILIIDEVLAVGDQLFQRKCYSKLQQLMDRGATVVMATHNLQVASGICTRAILLDQGRIVAQGEPKQTINAYQTILFSSEKKTQDNTVESKSAVHRSDTGPPLTAFPDPAVADVAADSTGRIALRNDGWTGLSSLYIADLNPRSTHIERNHDVDIAAVALLNQRGEQVNLLMPNREYHFCYKVMFNIDVDRVTFAITFRNEKGFPIGWSGGHHPKPRVIHLDEARAGDVYAVQWRFVCTFLPGQPFFLDAGVVGVIGEEEVRLCFIKDALVFKVLEFESPRRFGGMVQFDQELRFSKVVS